MKARIRIYSSFAISCLAATALTAITAGLGACVNAPPETATSVTTQDGISLQGTQLQGISLQGISLQGMNLDGFRVDGATLAGGTLTNVHVDRGELVADQGGTTLRGGALAGALLVADASDPTATQPVAQTVQYRIASIVAEDPQYDPTSTGHTYLYTLEQWNSESASWQSACPVDQDHRSVAIPLAAIWNAHGDRVESTTQFTFGCTTGVIAKCYRWGYRPWVTGYGDLTTMHWTCTRLARADYCGDGVPHTRNGTTINLWDTLPAPGPIQHHGGLLPPMGMTFEAGWNTGGAVCMSRARWVLDDGLDIARLCPDRLVPPGLLGGTVCDTANQVLNYDTGAQLFNESYLNL